jgi:KDO2-lipid IV(A) lauroyltransferase
MARRRSRAVAYLVYLLVRTVICVMQALPREAALALARGLGQLAYHVNRRHRLVAIDNVRHAFPDLDEPAADRLVRATYEHFVTVAAEMMLLPRLLRADNYKEYTHWAPPDGEAVGVAWARCGRPLLILTGHFGNWEVLGYTIGLVGLSASVLARKLDNPYLDRLLHDLRQKTGQVLLDKNEDYAKVLATLERGGFLGMLGDQDAGSRGLFVDFFGRPASTHKSIALLSLQYQAPVLVIGAARVGRPMRYRLYFEDVILPEEYEGSADAARAITQRYTRALERMVRRHPEQYFWLHRRWKHQPKAKAVRAA